MDVYVRGLHCRGFRPFLRYYCWCLTSPPGIIFIKSYSLWVMNLCKFHYNEQAFIRRTMKATTTLKEVKYSPIRCINHVQRGIHDHKKASELIGCLNGDRPLNLHNIPSITCSPKCTFQTKYSKFQVEILEML